MRYCKLLLGSLFLLDTRSYPLTNQEWAQHLCHVCPLSPFVRMLQRELQKLTFIKFYIVKFFKNLSTQFWLKSDNNNGNFRPRQMFLSMWGTPIHCTITCMILHDEVISPPKKQYAKQHVHTKATLTSLATAKFWRPRQNYYVTFTCT